MKVRTLTVDDIDRVMDAAALFDDPPVRTAVRAYLRHRRNVFLMAEDEGRAVGFLRGTELDQVDTPHRQMFLYEIAVDPRVQRRGVGRALVEALLADCRRRGLDEVFVFTDPGNTAAVGLYRATGAVTETPADRMFVYRLRPRMTSNDSSRP